MGEVAVCLGANIGVDVDSWCAAFIRLAILILAAIVAPSESTFFWMGVLHNFSRLVAVLSWVRVVLGTE